MRLIQFWAILEKYLLVCLNIQNLYKWANIFYKIPQNWTTPLFHWTVVICIIFEYLKFKIKIYIHFVSISCLSKYSKWYFWKFQTQNRNLQNYFSLNFEWIYHYISRMRSLNFFICRIQQSILDCVWSQWATLELDSLDWHWNQNQKIHNWMLQHILTDLEIRN